MISEADTESRPIKVLLVEDDEEDFFILRSLLSKISMQRYELQRTRDYDTALASLARNECDLCLLDSRLGQRSGIEFLKDSLASGCKAPIIFLTARGDDRVAMEAMEAGASDYLSKEALSSDLLERSIRYATQMAAARKEIDAQSARLKQVEATLQESRANLQAALDSMADAVFITDLEGRFIEFNDALAKFYRFGSKEECARTLDEYPKFLDACMDDGRQVPFDQWAVPKALRGERATNAEYTLRRKDSGETWIGSYSFGPIRDGRGAIVGSVVVARDITEQRRAERELYDSHREKTALLKEVHHRVKNNLQIVISLLGLQANRSKNPEVLAIFKDTQNRIRSMALLHEVLYRSGNLAQISFAVYIEDFLRHIAASYGRAAQRIKLERRVGDIQLPLNLAVPCGLIVNELVTNALKHAFPGGRAGKILVELARVEEEEVSLSVCDNGTGLPPEARSSASSTLGLTLVSELSRQLSGRLTMERPDGGGTVFRIRFPLSAGTTEGAQK